MEALLVARRKWFLLDWRFCMGSGSSSHLVRNGEECFMHGHVVDGVEHAPLRLVPQSTDDGER
jgi:hypothetical protein